jgi:hypothetical protein
LEKESYLGIQEHFIHISPVLPIKDTAIVTIGEVVISFQGISQGSSILCPFF